MARALDHLVLGTHDLDAAGALFTALGFSVGARNRHPWGTENRIIQFGDETFLELITVAENGLIPPHGLRHFSFGAFVRDALARRSGLSMLVLKGQDARADAAEFARAKIGDFEPFDFARKGKRPDGSDTEVAFSLAFARDETMPECGFFTCQQKFPQNFWSKAAQDHANGALGISRVTIVAENPSDHHIFLSSLVGERAMRSTSFGIEIEAGRGVIEIVSPEGFAFRYGEAAPVSSSPQFAGIGLRLSNLDGLRRQATSAAVDLREYGGALVLPGSSMLATTFMFEQEALL